MHGAFFLGSCRKDTGAKLRQKHAAGSNSEAIVKYLTKEPKSPSSRYATEPGSIDFSFNNCFPTASRRTKACSFTIVNAKSALPYASIARKHLYLFHCFLYTPHALFDIFVGSAVGYSDMSGAAEYLARYGRDSCFFKQP